MKVCIYLWFVLSVFVIASCNYDDSEIRKSVDDLDARVKTLEELCGQMNTNISSLQTLVTALQQNDAITAVIPVLQGDATIGYTITFAKASPITIYHGKDGGSDADGRNAYVPVIGAKQDVNDFYYWTLDGEWLLDRNGNKIKVVDGVTPQMKIDDAHWWVSVDNANTWIDCGDASTKGTDSYFKYIDNSDEKSVTITFSDDTFIKLPKLLPLQITFDAQDFVTIPTKGARDIHYMISNADERTAVEIVTSADLKAKVIPESREKGTIHIEALGAVDEYSHVTVFVLDSVSRITTAKLTFEESMIQLAQLPNISVAAKGGRYGINFLTNLEYEIMIEEPAASWITISPESRAVENYTIWFEVQPNTGDVRSGKIIVRDKHSNMQIDFIITQVIPFEMQLQKEREILMELYNATNGSSWSNNTNWGSDKPLNEWYGIDYAPEIGVVALRLGNNNLQRKIPASIGGLSSLAILDLSSNQLEGELPEEIGQLTQLHDLWLNNNKNFTRLPSSLVQCSALARLSIINTAINDLSSFIDLVSQLESLTYLDMSGVDEFNGPLPSSFTRIMDLPNLEHLAMQSCGFGGNIPVEILQHPRLNDFAFHLFMQPVYKDGVVLGGFENIDEVVYYLSDFSVEDVNGKIIDNQAVRKNKLTLLTLQMAEREAGFRIMKQLYDNYKDKGLDIITFFQVKGLQPTQQEEKWIQDMIRKYDMDWSYVIAIPGNVIRNLPNNVFISGGAGVDDFMPLSFIVDYDGKVLYNAQLKGTDGIKPFIEKTLGKGTTYTSTDYSRDGEVSTMQTASQGDGIDLVFLGDGFTDQDIANGTYDQVMEQAMENFFTTRPIASYRSRFNVHQVKVVSKHGRFSGTTETALSCRFGEGTEITGNNDKCIEYARRISGFVPSRTLIVTVLNDTRYAGTCYMYDNDFSIAYCPMVDGLTAERFTQIINHEAVGHGFAKLGDEYFYDYNLSMPADMIDSYRQQQTNGWYSNVDFTSDPASVSWSSFLSDARYTSEQLGIYEGALTYTSGVYRPSIGGIMNTNIGIFNAPSREAIYKRIMKLSEGDGWQYNREEFVSQDLDAIPTLAARARMRQEPPKDFVPLHPPVFKKYNY